MSKYLKFKEIPFEGKTKRFEILSKSTGGILGKIIWFSKWRQYIFEPSYLTIWNRKCMNDVIFFIDNLMKDRKIILMKNKNENS